MHVFRVLSVLAMLLAAAPMCANAKAATAPAQRAAPTARQGVVRIDDACVTVGGAGRHEEGEDGGYHGDDENNEDDNGNGNGDGNDNDEYGHPHSIHHPEGAATTTPQPSEAPAPVIHSFSSWILRLG
jgi:hypothetical protein